MFRKTLLFTCAAALWSALCFAADEAPAGGLAASERARSSPLIQVAILLDTSGSMDGLINQTREQLWRIVNTFATAKRDGKRARLELALYQYGNDGLPAAQHYVQRIVPLTNDLDKISEALFKLTTNGGSEYCGAAVSHAVGELEWSANPKDLKLIYIAGNESFAQGPVAFRESVKAAITRGIVVNTIHAGTERQGISDHWAEAAKLADGNFLFIDSNRAVARIDAPQDAELAKLSKDLNKTYITYGARGHESAARQGYQDANAGSLSAGSASTRAVAKASPLYRNSDWDLVDAKADGRKVLDDELPAELRKLSEEERTALVKEKAKERAELQAKINKLAGERDLFLQSEMKRRAANSSKTMDDALLESARSQAEKASYAF